MVEIAVGVSQEMADRCDELEAMHGLVIIEFMSFFGPHIDGLALCLGDAEHPVVMVPIRQRDTTDATVRQLIAAFDAGEKLGMKFVDEKPIIH